MKDDPQLRMKIITTLHDDLVPVIEPICAAKMHFLLDKLSKMIILHT